MGRSQEASPHVRTHGRGPHYEDSTYHCSAGTIRGRSGYTLPSHSERLSSSIEVRFAPAYSITPAPIVTVAETLEETDVNTTTTAVIRCLSKRGTRPEQLHRQQRTHSSDTSKPSKRTSKLRLFCWEEAAERRGPEMATREGGSVYARHSCRHPG